jgi:hypothetical protein
VVGGILLEYNTYSNISAFSGILWNKILREVFQYRIPWNTVFYGIPYSMKCGILVEISIPWSTVFQRNNPA